MTLTSKQRNILQLIIDFRQSRGISPTYREIMDLAGVKSTAVVRHYLRILKAYEYISTSEGLKSRGIKVLKDADGNPFIDDALWLQSLKEAIREGDLEKARELVGV